MNIGLHSCLILTTLEFFWQIFNKYSITNLKKIHPVGAELFHADGRMDGRRDMMTLPVAFRNFVNVPKNAY